VGWGVGGRERRGARRRSFPYKRKERRPGARRDGPTVFYKISARVSPRLAYLPAASTSRRSPELFMLSCASRALSEICKSRIRHNGTIAIERPARHDEAPPFSTGSLFLPRFTAPFSEDRPGPNAGHNQLPPQMRPTCNFSSVARTLYVPFFTTSLIHLQSGQLQAIKLVLSFAILPMLV
jgi:hypothetical protein